MILRNSFPHMSEGSKNLVVGPLYIYTRIVFGHKQPSDSPLNPIRLTSIESIKRRDTTSKPLHLPFH